MKAFLLWVNISWRVALAMVVSGLLFGSPIAYILFASAPLNPLATLASWRVDGIGLRLLAAALFIIALSMILGLLGSRANNVSRAINSPWQDIATILRQIGSGDFRVRIGTSTARIPHELIEIREALNAMAADLERAEELRNNLMADVSHELRTPLTALEGNLRAALDRVYPLDEAEIANLYAQTRHLIRLVNDLHELALADARQLPLDLQPTDLTQLLNETLALFAPLAEEQGVTLRASVDGLPTVTVDTVRIRQVLHNLLSNALRHTPSGGEIAVSGALEHQEAVIAISDTGDGLELDQLGAIFDRFYRTDKSRSRDTGGTGLGLAIVSAIVATHGGSVAASSAGLGKGSTFAVRLPVGEGKR